MDAADKPTSAAGRKALDDPRIHRYYVRLTSEQNERFLRMYEHSGMKNKADFICHRILDDLLRSSFETRTPTISMSG